MQHNHSTTNTITASNISPTEQQSSIQLQSDKSNRTFQNQQNVESFLAHCGLSQYYNIFIEEGFDRTESLLDITESDLIQMQVKRGHRRLLQRAVANVKGIPASVPLNITPILDKEPAAYDVAGPPSAVQLPQPPTLTQLPSQQTGKKILQPAEAIDVSLHSLAGASPMNTSSASSSSGASTQPEYFPSAGTMTQNQSGMSSTEEEAVTSDNVHRLWKRKYHRHAKPDTNAPLKPPSAYVMFSNDVRAELKQQNKSFTDLAKIIGDRWKNITPEEKELYESNALRAREEYLKKIEEYQKTDSYKKYQQYISDFKAENEAAARPVGRPRKRHRRDGELSDGATSTSTKPDRASSISSQSEDPQQSSPKQQQRQKSKQTQQPSPQQQQQQQQPQQLQQPQQQPHNRNQSFSDQRHYPFYLMNEVSLQREASRKSLGQPTPLHGAKSSDGSPSTTNGGGGIASNTPPSK